MVFVVHAASGMMISCGVEAAAFFLIVSAGTISRQPLHPVYDRAADCTSRVRTCETHSFSVFVFL